MYNNIRAAINDITAAFDTGRSTSSIEAEVEEEFSHFELCTLNEHLGKLSHDAIVNYVRASQRPANMSELMHDFFNAVHLGL